MLERQQHFPLIRMPRCSDSLPQYSLKGDYVDIKRYRYLTSLIIGVELCLR